MVPPCGQSRTSVQLRETAREGLKSSVGVNTTEAMLTRSFNTMVEVEGISSPWKWHHRDFLNNLE